MALPPALVERFTRHLAEVLSEVAALEAEAVAGGERREALRAIAHKLAGTAGPYGFPAVGESAVRLEAAILTDEAWAPAVAERVRGLQEALAAAVGATGG